MLLALAGGAAAGACARRPKPARPVMRSRGNELILCGGDEVFILAVGTRRSPETRKIWSWRANDSYDMPLALRGLFKSTDDCKPVEGGRHILITSSGGAVALVERETKRATFYALVVNAHSAEMLPGGRIVVASSVSQSPRGNRLVLFDVRKPQKEVFSERLESAHGVVWDDERQVLWALGYEELRAYRLHNWQSASPALRREATFELPDTDGHDLAPVPRTPLLFVSTGRHGWHFDRSKGRFVAHDALANAASIKSYSVNPLTGQIAYIQAEGSNWWAERVHFLRPRGMLHLPGERLYKVRWNA
jgi:hypothetical protein